MSLSPSEKERYTRQLLLPDWDQQKLKSASVLIAGVGGLGSPIALYLAAAGVGRLHLVDGDRVARSDLNRQVLYSEDSLDQLKAEAAAKRLRALNGEIEIKTTARHISSDNIDELVGECDLLVDGLDNMEARFLLNGVSVKRKIPYIYGAVQGWEGFVGLFHPPHTACLGCFMEKKVSRPEVIPVPGVLPGVIGLLEATEALKFLMGVERSLAGHLLIYDSRALTFDLIQVEKTPNCRYCKI
ncbi:MAG: HesA/MoeB/ThiF family protein [bacterium]|nr:HesA/MoeB/ThiF family protein [bacterium]